MNWNRRAKVPLHNHPHILHAVAEFFTANSPQPRAATFTSKWHLTLTQLAWQEDCSFSTVRLEDWFSTSLRLPRGYSRASAHPAVRWAFDFLGPISYRGHHTALISAFNIQVESPSQHLFLCNMVWAHAITSYVIFTHSFDSVASKAFSLEDLRVSERIFRSPTTSGWLLPETILCFLNSTGKSRSSLVTSAHFNVITIALQTTFPALSRVTYTPSFCFPLFPHFSFSEWPFPSPTNFGSLTLFLIYATAHRNCPASCTPLFFWGDAHPWLFLRLQLLHTLFTSLIVLFLPFSVSVVLCLLVKSVFFCVSVLAKLSMPIFPWVGILI